MNKRQLINLLDNFADEDEIKVVQKDGEDTIRLVIIRKEQAEEMNEALGLAPVEVPVIDFESPTPNLEETLISLDEAHNREMLDHENFPPLDTELYPEGRDFEEEEIDSDDEIPY